MNAVTMHVVSSLDGFIASSDNTVAWLESPDDAFPDGVEMTPESIQAELASIDCYVMGSRTYEHALELGWPYGDKPVIVLTHRDLSAARESVEFHKGELEGILGDVIRPRFGSIWVVGGAALCQAFLERRLIDRIVLTVAPITLGGGLRLFGRDSVEQRWLLDHVVAYKNGFVEMTYVALMSDR